MLLNTRNVQYAAVDEAHTGIVGVMHTFGSLTDYLWCIETWLFFFSRITEKSDKKSASFWPVLNNG